MAVSRPSHPPPLCVGLRPHPSARPPWPQAPDGCYLVHHQGSAPRTGCWRTRSPWQRCLAPPTWWAPSRRRRPSRLRRGGGGGGEGGVAPRVSSRLLFFGGRVGTLGTLRSALCDMPCTGVRRASHWRRGMRRGARARGIDGPGRAGKGATCGLLTAGTFTALSCWVCRNVFSPPSPPPIPLCLLCPTVPLGRYYAHLTSDAVPLPTPPAPPAPGVTYTLFGVPQVVRVARRHRRRFGSWP